MKYLSGFGAHHETEALEGALPIGQNSPQRVPFGLYAEQLSGTSFTAPRRDNRRSWLYRLRPTAAHSAPSPRLPIASDGILGPLRRRPRRSSTGSSRWQATAHPPSAPASPST